MEHSEGTFRGSGRLVLYYQRWRPDGDARAVVAIVHGFGEHSGRYLNVVNSLTPRGYAICGLDLRGHGRSPGQRGHINEWGEYREDVRAFLQMVGEQEPGRPLFLLGHSLGGLIVLEYALRSPDRLQGVIASAPSLAQVSVSPFKILLARLLSCLWSRFTMEVGLEVSALSHDPAVVKGYREDPLVHGKGTARFGAESLRAMAWTNAHAADLHLPLLIVHGAADRVVSPEGSLAFFTHVTFADKKRREYPDAYHEVHNDTSREQMLTDLARWLERHLPGSWRPENA